MGYNYEEFKIHAEEVLNIKNQMKNNKKLFYEIQNYKQYLDYFIKKELFYQEYTIIDSIDETYILNILFEYPYINKEHSLREDIMVPNIEGLRKVNLEIINIIKDFRENIFEYFVQKTQAKEYIILDGFLCIDYKAEEIHKGIIKDNSFYVTSYGISILSNKENKCFSEWTSNSILGVELYENVDYGVKNSVNRYLKQFSPELFI